MQKNPFPPRICFHSLHFSRIIGLSISRFYLERSRKRVRGPSWLEQGLDEKKRGGRKFLWQHFATLTVVFLVCALRNESLSKDLSAREKEMIILLPSSDDESVPDFSHPSHLPPISSFSFRPPSQRDLPPAGLLR